MSLSGVLGDVLATADSFRGHALEWFGPFAGIVTTSAQLLAAALALLLIGAGRRLWAPPGQGLQDFAPRIAGLLSAVAVLILYVTSYDTELTLSFLRVAIWAAGALTLAGAGYIIAYQLLAFRCPGEQTVFVRGFCLDPDAKRVLDNDQGPPPLPIIRRITGTIRPTDACDYFCKADRSKPEFVWTKGSHVAAQLLLTFLYIPLAVSIIVLLAASALAVQQVDTKVIEVSTSTVVRVPANLLFDFNKSTLKPDATSTLENIAKMIRERWKSGPVIIAGYTDSIGSDDVNLQLSRNSSAERRQMAANRRQASDHPLRRQGCSVLPG